MPGPTTALEAAATESPFYLRGYIDPQYTAAWSVMKWHDAVLSNVLRDLDRDPPEYILVRAPALSGKTTFAMQLIERAGQATGHIRRVPAVGNDDDLLVDLSRADPPGVCQSRRPVIGYDKRAELDPGALGRPGVMEQARV